jgi:DNA polymerase-4
MDECWLDVSASRLAFGNGVTIGNTIRSRCRNELGLTVSVGLSFNKIFAKLGSDLKKPDALTVLPPDDFKSIVYPLPVGHLLGVGRKNEAVLKRFGIHTIGKLAEANEDLLRSRFGKIGVYLKEAAEGKDCSPVLPAYEETPIKSIGRGMTVAKDLKEEQEVWLLILRLVQEIGEKLRFHRLMARGIALDCKTADFSHQTLQKQLSAPSDCTMTLAQEAFLLFRERYLFRTPLRSVSVRAISLCPAEEGVQLSLFEDPRSLRLQALDRVSDQIRSRWGAHALTQASLLNHPFSQQQELCSFHAP